MNTWPDGGDDAVPQREEHQLGGRLPHPRGDPLARPDPRRRRVQRDRPAPRLAADVPRRRRRPRRSSRTSRPATTSATRPSRCTSTATTCCRTSPARSRRRPRRGMVYFSDDGDVLGLRFDNWKIVFMEQRVPGHAAGLGRARSSRCGSRRSSTCAPIPFERADITSNTYWDWIIEHAYLVHRRPAADRPSSSRPSRSSRPARRRRRSRSTRPLEKLAGGDHHRTLTDRSMPPGRRRDRWAIPGGTFTMGSDRHYPEEAPAHPVTVDGFWIDRTPVTNAAFDAFVRATGYVTVAERPLDPAAVPRRAGREPGARLARVHRHARAGRPAPPVAVVGVDARRVAGGGRTAPAAASPTSATTRSCTSPTRTPTPTRRGSGPRCRPRREWEFAARGGLDGAAFTWGDDPRPGGRLMANVWNGDFPWRNTLADGFARTSPVGSFPPTATGCPTWPGTSGSGRPTGTPSAIPSRRPAVLRARRTRPAARRRPATTRPNRSSRSRGR